LGAIKQDIADLEDILQALTKLEDLPSLLRGDQACQVASNHCWPWC